RLRPGGALAPAGRGLVPAPAGGLRNHCVGASDLGWPPPLDRHVTVHTFASHDWHASRVSITGELVRAPDAHGNASTEAPAVSQQLLLERLAALVARPRRPLVTYHGGAGAGGGSQERRGAVAAKEERRREVRSTIDPRQRRWSCRRQCGPNHGRQAVTEKRRAADQDRPAASAPASTASTVGLDAAARTRHNHRPTNPEPTMRPICIAVSALRSSR